jgi:hypothetical protein
MAPVPDARGTIRYLRRCLERKGAGVEFAIASREQHKIVDYTSRFVAQPLPIDWHTHMLDRRGSARRVICDHLTGQCILISIISRASRVPIHGLLEVARFVGFIGDPYECSIIDREW